MEHIHRPNRTTLPDFSSSSFHIQSNHFWVPVPETCPQTNATQCTFSRGAFGQLLPLNVSSTWKEVGIYDLALESELGFKNNGIYGIDSIGQEIANSGGIDLSHQVVAATASTDFYLGVFGLDPKLINFLNFEHPVPSYIWSLKDQKKIPSISFGYTAGAAYREILKPRVDIE